MSLRDIKSKLYKRGVSRSSIEHEISQYNPKAAKDTGEMAKGEKDLWVEKQSLGKSEKKVIKKGIVILSVVLLIIIGLSIFAFVRRGMFQDGNTTISISGPTQANSGKLLTYEINYKNSNRLDIDNAVLKITYSENFKPEENSGFQIENLTSGSFNIGTIKGESEGKVVLNGKAFSPKGALIYLRATLSYRPSGYSSQFQTNDQLGINVISAPITLEVLAPQSVSSGDSVDYQINYKNDGEEVINNIIVATKYSDGFTFSSANPKASRDNNSWDIGNLQPGQAGKIIVSGKLEGERENIKKIEASIGTMENDKFVAFNTESADTKIISSPLLIAQAVNGQQSLNVNAGDTLEFQIKYKNSGSIGLRDVIVTETIDSSVLDYSSLKMDNGSFDIDTKTIIWKASDIKQLQNLGVGQEGSIYFSINVKSTLPVGEKKDKNFVIKSVAKIDSPDVPTPISMNKTISSNEINMKVNSRLAVSVKGYYNDQDISNSGPVPPKVGEETTYTIHWQAFNVSNDVSGVKVSAILPTDSQMTGKIFPEDAKIEYNSRTNSIVWTIGDMESGEGILSDAPEVAFQVKIKPSPNKVGQEIKLLGETTITGQDLFTNENLKNIFEEKTTDLREDSSIAGKRTVEN